MSEHKKKIDKVECAKKKTGVTFSFFGGGLLFGFFGLIMMFGGMMQEVTASTYRSIFKNEWYIAGEIAVPIGIAVSLIAFFKLRQPTTRRKQKPAGKEMP